MKLLLGAPNSQHLKPAIKDEGSWEGDMWKAATSPSVWQMCKTPF